MIELLGVSLRKGERQIMSSLDLHVSAGETVAISGASGSGKTTLLRLIAGLESPDDGEVRLAGHTVGADKPPHRRNIGFLFQTSALWPHLSVAGNILFGLEQFPRAWRDERLRYLLARIELDGFATRVPATLSGGEARRVALARALAPQRAILLLDEPTSNLNPQLRERMLALINDERQARGTTILLATHEALEAERLASRHLTLDDGHLSKATEAAACASNPP